MRYLLLAPLLLLAGMLASGVRFHLPRIQETQTVVLNPSQQMESYLLSTWLPHELGHLPTTATAVCLPEGSRFRCTVSLPSGRHWKLVLPPGRTSFQFPRRGCVECASPR